MFLKIFYQFVEEKEYQNTGYLQYAIETTLLESFGGSMSVDESLI